MTAKYHSLLLEEAEKNIDAYSDIADKLKDVCELIEKLGCPAELEYDILCDLQYAAQQKYERYAEALDEEAAEELRLANSQYYASVI